MIVRVGLVMNKIVVDNLCGSQISVVKVSCVLSVENSNY